MSKSDTIPKRLAALKTMPAGELKAQWRELFDSEPPPFNRRFLETRLAYRIQELAYVQESVKLIRGFIVVQTHRPTSPEVTRELVEAWYRDRALIKFPERIELCLGHFPDPEAFRPKGLIVRQTRQRWGPCRRPDACC